MSNSSVLCSSCLWVCTSWHDLLHTLRSCLSPIDYTTICLLASVKILKTTYSILHLFEICNKYNYTSLIVSQWYSAAGICPPFQVCLYYHLSLVGKSWAYHKHINWCYSNKTPRETYLIYWFMIYFTAGPSLYCVLLKARTEYIPLGYHLSDDLGKTKVYNAV